jgi:hypothetical protein
MTGISGSARAALLRGDHLLRATVALSVLLFVVSAAAAIGQLAWSDRIDRRDGCGFDGYYYCLMLKGTAVPTPFSRRVLLPSLAKQVSTDTLAGFWVVNVLSLVGVVVIAMYVAWRLRPVAGDNAPAAYRIVPPLLVGAAFLLARNTFHIVATYPALSDPVALLLLMGAVALVVTPALPSTRLLLVPVCFLAPLARVELVGILSLALVLAALMHMLPWLLALAASGAGAVGAAYAFHQPNAGGAGVCLTRHNTYVACPESIQSTLRFWLDWDFGSWNGFLRFGVMLILALGPFVFLLGMLRERTWNGRSALWIAGVAAIFTAVSIFGGGDTDRILTPAGLLLALAVLVSGGRSGKALLGLAVVVAAYAVQQEPFYAVSGEPTAWLTFFGLRVTTLSSVVDNGLIPSLIALPLAVAGYMLLRSGRRNDPERRLDWPAV